MKKLTAIRIFFVALVLVSVAPASESVSLPTKSFRVYCEAKQIMIIFGGRRHVLQVADYVKAAVLKRVDLLFASSVGNTLYLVIDAQGWSKTQRDDRHCGAGWENNLLWIKLGKDWKPIALQSALYESCWCSFPNV